MPKLIRSLLIILILLSPFPARSNEITLPEYSLTVSIDLPASRLTGVATIALAPDMPVTITTSDLIIKNVSLNGVAMDRAVTNNRIAIRTAPAEGGRLTIEYEGVFKGGTSSGSGSPPIKERVIDANGIFLTGAWYPKIEGPARYRLRVNLPAGYEAVSEADAIEKNIRDGQWEFHFQFDHPLDGLSLVAGRYALLSNEMNGVEIVTYYLPEDRGHAAIRLAEARDYLEQYEKLLSRFPYRRISLVESVRSLSAARPTIALIDRDDFRLPRAGSPLRDQILSEWFGNAVFVDPEQGNWAAGLVACLGEHLSEEQAGRGREFRKQLLLDYASRVNAKNETSLRGFRDGTDGAGRAIGRGKGALVFHMLRRSLGDTVFFEGLRELIAGKRFQRASWDDVRLAFEHRAGSDLAPFFKQWVDGKGLAELVPDKPAVQRSGDIFEVTFTLDQHNLSIPVEVPAVLTLANGAFAKELLNIGAGKTSISLTAIEEPRNLVIDPDYDLARELTDEESPPLIETFFGDESRLIVLPATGRDTYQGVIDRLKEQGALVKEATDLTDASLKSASVVVLGRDNPIIDRLYGGMTGDASAAFDLIARKNPWNPRKVVLLMHARTDREAAAGFAQMLQSGRYSRMTVDRAGGLSRKTDESQRGMLMELRERTMAIDLSSVKTLTQAVTAAAGNRIIYLGEYHDKFAHHAVQLQMIRSLHEKGLDLAIGMEMFQRPFQKVLDDYLGGMIDERAFLKQSEYFKRWVFDYNLYKPILDFAREHRIPVVALNQRKEITDKVSKSGLDSLTDEERSEVPRQMDFSDAEYRDRLKSAFDQHPSAAERSFDYFFEAQVLWDETMAESINEFLRKNPERRMVVIAGSGHLSYGSGIPKRAFRRNSLPYFIALNDSEVEPDIANYLLLPQPLEGIAPPKLMAVLKVENNTVSVIELPEGSVSKKAGITVGDRILSLDNEKVESVEDIRLVLFFKKKGETVSVKVIRKRFFLGDREMQFEVKL